MESAIVNLDNMNTITDQIDYDDYSSNDFDDGLENLGDNDGILIEAKIDIDENDVTLDSANDREQIKEIDLSKSNLNNGIKRHISYVQNKNRIIIPFVTQNTCNNDQQTLHKGNPMSKQHITNNGIMRESKAKKWFEDKNKDSISQVTHNTHHNINVVCSPRNLEDEQKVFNDSVVKESEGPTIVQMENENEAHISKFKKNTLRSSHKAVPMVLENKQKNPNNVVETEEQKSKQIGTEVSISQVRYNTNHNTREVSSPMNLESKQKISKKSTVMELEEPKTKRFENKVTILQIKHKTHHNTHAGPSHMDLGSKQKVFNERIIVASEKSRGKQIENSNKVSISPDRHNAHHDTREVSCPMELESKRKVFHDRIDIELEESRANQIENKEVSISHVRQSTHHNDHEASNQRLSEMNPKSIIGSIVMNSEESRTKHKNEISISPVIHKTHHNTREVPVQMDLENKRKILNDSAVMELGEPRTKQIENKNEISISQVRQHNTHHNTHGVSSQMDSESKRKIDSIIIESEEPKSKKHKQENKPCSNKVVMNLKPSRQARSRMKPNSYSVPVEGNISYEIQEVMYEMKAFGNVKLSVHKLHIPTIKNETSEECSKMQSSTNIYDYKTPMPSTSSTPDVGVLLSEIKTEPGVVSKPITVNKVPKVEDTIPTSTSNFLDYNAAQRGKQRKTVKILKIKNAKTREQPDGAQMNTSSSSQQAQSSVIQHPVKTEPPPPYDTKHGILYCQPGSSKTSATNPEPPKNSAGNFLGIDLPSVSNLPQLDRPPTVDITPSKYLPTNLNSPSLESPIQDYNFLVANTKLDRLSNLHNGEYDSVDTPHWLLRGINILPQVIEDDRISCASPKTLLNLDHQTSFEPDDSGSTSINMQTDEMMPPRGELSGQESLESSVWGYQEDNGAPQYHRQWDEMDHEVMDNISNSNSFRTKIEKIEPINSLPDNIKMEESVSILPIISSLDIAKKKKHACIYCKKTFTGWKLRKYHMKAEHPELFNEPETIKLLSKTQASTSTVISEPSTSFVSQAVCPIKFENSNSFGTQIQEFLPPSLTSIKNKQRRCDTCSEVFDKLKDYQEHIKNVHPLPCPVCSKTFPSKPSLTLHMRTHLKIKPYKCDVCDKSFVTAQKLSDHKNTHTGNAPFPCNMCDRHFKRYSNLAQHKKVIHLKKKKIKDFYCHCGEIFQSRGKLLWHQETHATVPKQCTYCTEKFTHTSSLTRHIRKNHDPRYLPVDRKKTDENVNCDICKIVVLKSTLKSHMRIHDNAKPFSCTVCKKSFYTKWNLGLHQWTHVSRMHMPFKCKSCNRGFYSSSEYQAHLRSHRNIRPFTCNYCGRKFIRKFNCIRHVREHELKKKYSCTICGKTFHRSYYLTAHVRVHNGERPFSCHICGKTSTTKSNHNKHVKTHHARETINTEG
ncbi:uncharacterized protein LOC103513418 [Diaphorina citri]|uniref:Uncharacterized protein LOC103513418 n=1 Tax=Diaphorina citri TaxID=121845 RepID=A0A1S3D867_DIACI|nr:uncharacterized protein LOC103513418 [Diaphorina citri]